MSRLSVDIGGTFTDVVLEQGGERTSLKTLTTPEAPDLGAMNGIRKLLAESRVEPADISTVIHGTTLATNALIERRGARTAFVTTEGFRDIVEMGYEKRFDQYDVNLQLPEPLVPRERRYVVRERVDASGAIREALSMSEVDALAAILTADRVEAVAVGLLHAYANPAHEQALAERLRQRLDASVTICLSGEVSPEIREYERFSTVTANAYVRPLMRRYLSRFDASLRADGFDGQFMLMLSGGGLTTLEQAIRTPIRLVESGPAGGVAFGARIARELGCERLLSFDMGGTTAKICFLENAVPDTARRFEVARAWLDKKGSGLPVRIPTTELVEIGAGGGSIARRDAIGRLAVGPESAGSTPGPAAYGRGGTAATVSDADVVLGKLDPEEFASGAFVLRPDLAADAVRRSVTEPLGLDDDAWAAAGVVEISEEAMANAARVHGLERGKDVARYDLVATGGAGPLHAVRVADKLGIRRVIVPSGAGVGSAIGFLAAPVAYEVARSVMVSLDGVSLDVLVRLQDALRVEALDVVSPALGERRADISLQAELRHVGQGHALRIELDSPLTSRDDVDALAERFFSRYADIYGVALRDIPLELVSLALIASGPAPQVDQIANGGPGRSISASHSENVFDSKQGVRTPCSVYLRAALAPGDRLESPCLVREAQTTTYVPAGWQCSAHVSGHLIPAREEVS